MRGEYFEYERPPLRPLGSPPLARGVQTTVAHYFGYEGIIPACAGSTGRANEKTVSMQDHPRLRGEYYMGFEARNPPLGSSPLTRGVPGIVIHDFPVIGIIPAYAGSTYFRIIDFVNRRDHPRLRGEYHCP